MIFISREWEEARGTLKTLSTAYLKELIRLYVQVNKYIENV